MTDIDSKRATLNAYLPRWFVSLAKFFVDATAFR